LYKVARAYYDDDLTQQQIGHRFGLSRVKVSRLLRQARSEKIVQITINAHGTTGAELERAIEQRFGLREAVVVTSSGDDMTAPTAAIGPVTARYLLRNLQGDETLAISWGNTLLSVVNAVPAASMPALRVVQLTGGLGELEARTHGAELARRTAEIFGARLRLLHSPGIVKDQAVRDALVNDPQISDTLRLAADADVALVGIGVLQTASTLLKSNQLLPEEIAHLKDKGAVGDIALRFFDADGRKVESLIDRRIVGCSLDDIRRIPRVIAAAGGTEKLTAIMAALKGKLIDVLITDDRTGEKLIE